jgi:hypothetical protein
MRPECCEQEKTGRKQRGLLKLLALARGSRAHPACNVYFNHDEVGKASNSRISAGLVNFENYFSRVGDCENQGGIDRLMNGRRCAPTVRSGMEASVPTFFHGSTDVRTSVLPTARQER